MTDQNVEIAVLGGGCFWCVEAVFAEIAGITAVTSGYSGGRTVNPTYYEVCSEKTGLLCNDLRAITKKLETPRHILAVIWTLGLS